MKLLSITEYPCKPSHLRKVLELMNSTSTLEETLNRLITTLSPLAHQLNYTISFFDIPSHNSSKHITVSHKSPGFEPAPITSGDSESFKLLAGTGKAAFGKELVVAPTGMYGMSAFLWLGIKLINSEHRY
jgi:hypothetical protein